MPHKSHEVHIKAEDHKTHPGGGDGYVPHHPEPGHGDNPHAKQPHPLWEHSQGDCQYDHSAHESGHTVANITGEQDGIGQADDFRKMHHAHINKEVHSFHGAKQVGGRLRMSGHKGAHRVGHRGK
jgi:hypothetical protein